MVEYAIAGSYREFMRWRREDVEARGGVIYLTPGRAAGSRQPRIVHRIGNWQESPAVEAALRLEASAS